jgi:hypothetical protein
MKFFLSALLLIMLTACSERGNQAVYDMLHERERQECLKLGRSDCYKGESYNKYKQQRDEVITPQDPAQVK